MKSKIQKISIFLIVIITASYITGFCLNCFIANNYKFELNTNLLTDKLTIQLSCFFFGLSILAWCIYYYKHYWLKNLNKIIQGNSKDNSINTNLESARFQSDKEIKKNFKSSTFVNLDNTSISGIPIRAIQHKKSYDINFASPAHTLIIGTTGSGKTTTFINPTIQALSKSGAKNSMIITDPKAELYQLHAKSLKERGYDIKILDFRNPFHSIKWNPLERPYLNYQRMLHIEDEATADEENGCWIFEGKTYYDITELKSAYEVKKQELNALVYEDLDDIMTVLCPIKNKNEPVWESGAKNFMLAIALAMLEDSEDPKLGMTKEKYNFYNLRMIASNTDKDCADLATYFQNRSPVSRSVTLSKQILAAADKTRGSYVSTMIDKLNIFADLSICSLTSENEIDFSTISETPTAVFLQIPDEKETRHALASMVILQAYKELVIKANSYPDLSLSRSVFFLLDEFGNMPAVHRLEQMITVGRSRNIWLSLVVQSYAQLAKVYDEKVAEIIKSNCNIQIFIGSSDLKTIEDFSKKCGNKSVLTRSGGTNTASGNDINSNASVKERPLIYPSELQQLNSPGNMGNAIVSVFGYQPIRSMFTPSFLCSSLKLEKTIQKQETGRFFNEKNLFYDMKIRNKNKASFRINPKRMGLPPIPKTEYSVELLKEQAERLTANLLNDDEKIKLLNSLENKAFAEALILIEEAIRRAQILRQDHMISALSVLKEKLSKIINEIKEENELINLMGGKFN